MFVTSRFQLTLLAFAGALSLPWTGLTAHAQPATQPAAVQPGQVKLNFPENLELKVLVDYAGQRLGINFIYDEQIGGKRITIKSPQEIPAASLMPLVDSALRMKGLALARTDVPGTMRIEAARQLTAVSTGPMDTAVGENKQAAQGSQAWTRVFTLKFAKPQRVGEVVTPFLSVPTANLIALPEHGLVVITDYAENMKRIEDLVALVDRPGRDVEVAFIEVKNQEATALAPQMTQLLAGKGKARDGGAGTAASSLTVIADERTNRLMLVGTADETREATDLAKKLDVSLGLETKIYTLATASVEQLDRLAKRMIGEPASKRLYRAVSDRESNLLVVTATPEIHRQLDLLCKTMDKPVADAQSPIRFYKLENTKATSILATLQSIQGDKGLGGLSVDGMVAPPFAPDDRAVKGPTQEQVNTVIGDDPSGTGADSDKAAGTARGRSAEVGGVRIMADEASNTIIIVAKPNLHPIYEKLIKRLDIRRPQVLLEATLVTLDTTDDFKLGVEFSRTVSVNGGEGKALNFTKFGLSVPDPATGALALVPGMGFNGALISSDLANIIIQALKNDKRVWVQAQPSVLVNDNITGKLVSQREEPYVTVNASSQVALNTFGGYSSAGTNISIKPQISEGDYLRLEYEITLSSFEGTGADGIPPARQTSTLKSEATIPDGYTIVLGGLTRDTQDDNIDRVPLLGELPLLEYAFSNRRNTAKKSTLFVFIRAVILRSDKFEDLKALSGDARDRAGVGTEYPASLPVVIR